MECLHVGTHLQLLVPAFYSESWKAVVMAQVTGILLPTVGTQIEIPALDSVLVWMAVGQ